jgi:hypothetical protein
MTTYADDGDGDVAVVINIEIESIIDTPANIDCDFISDVRRHPCLCDLFAWYARMSRSVARHKAMVGTAPKTKPPDEIVASSASSSATMIIERCMAIARGTMQHDRMTNGPNRKLSMSNDDIARRGPSIEESATRIRGGDDEASA